MATETQWRVRAATDTSIPFVPGRRARTPARAPTPYPIRAAEIGGHSAASATSRHDDALEQLRAPASLSPGRERTEQRVPLDAATRSSPAASRCRTRTSVSGRSPHRLSRGEAYGRVTGTTRTAASTAPGSPGARSDRPEPRVDQRSYDQRESRLESGRSRRRCRSRRTTASGAPGRDPSSRPSRRPPAATVRWNAHKHSGIHCAICSSRWA